MLKIDCRNCENCDMAHDRCSIFGNDPKKAVKACADNGFKDYCPVCNTSKATKGG